MKLYLGVLLFLFFLVPVFSQQPTKVAVVKENNYSLINAENQSGVIYISLQELLSESGFFVDEKSIGTKISFALDGFNFELEANVPYIKIKSKADDETKIAQLSSIPYQKNNQLYISLNNITDIINTYWNDKFILLSPNRVRIIKEVKKEILVEKEKELIQIKSLIVKQYNDNAEVRINSNQKINNFYSFYRKNVFHLILWDSEIKTDSILQFSPNDFINDLSINKEKNYVELLFTLNKNETITEIFNDKDNELLLRISEQDYGDWYVKETEHFKILYRDAHSHLINHILQSAENSLATLKKVFEYIPSEKIIINTYDVSDYGAGATVTVPENYMRIEIEPLEPGYELVPFNERFQWLLSHELVHIIVNDMAGNFESSLRSIFGKVSPDKNQPITTFFSLLTNHNRYTSRWYQEAIAVFFETWLSGGYGRILGNFDEMYFRSLIIEGKSFPKESELEQVYSHTNILLEELLYLYGTRFIAYLSIKYGTEKIIEWYKTLPDEFYYNNYSKFYDIYGVDFDDAWEDFTDYESEFQKENINVLSKSGVTDLKKISDENLGWVTQPFYDSKSNTILVGAHKSGELACVKKINLNNYKKEEVTTLPSPSMIQVSSFAFDEAYQNLFFTTNNNQLYRDVWIKDLKTGSERCILPDVRVGHLTISAEKHELWGIQHVGGRAILVRSKYPYTELQSLVVFNVGDELLQLSINQKGDFLAATLHRSNGQQSIILADIQEIDRGKPFLYKTISSSGTPEGPAWSKNGRFIYWSAYTNGVSNIYRYDLKTENIIALTNVLTGVFRPVEISDDSLLAFEFSTEGFIPVIFKIKQAEKLPAINYLGQKIFDRSPELINLTLKPANDVFDKKNISIEKSYNGLAQLSFKTFIPVITGFQSRIVLGIFSQINDPLMMHDFIIEAGISPFKETTKDIKYHLRLKYSYNQKFILAAEHNASDFLDLFNKRKRGMLGSKYSVGYTNYWVYDNPLKIKQNTELSVYNGIKFINDNLTEVKQPDFAVFKTEFDLKYLRKTIGSIDWESGEQFKFTVLGYASNPNAPEYSGQVFSEFDKFFLTLFDHNVFHIKLFAGYHFVNENLPETKFFFGGFGNRAIENEPVKQYSKMFRFAGVPIYSIVSDKFFKVMFENSFPPFRIPNIYLSKHDLKNINLSIFSNLLISDSPTIDKIINAGAQINILFEHWANLESTVSFGFANAWWKNGNDKEWFISWKLLRD